MIIFSNDYLSNFTVKKLSSGGPANFARQFSDYVVKKKNIWHGLSIVAYQGKRLYLSKIIKGKKIFWQIKVNNKIIKDIGKARRKINPSVVLRPLIDKTKAAIRQSRADIVFLNGFSLSNWVILQAAKEENKKIAVQHAGILTKEIDIYRDFFSVRGRELLIQMEKNITDIVDCEIFLNEFSRNIYNNTVRKVPAAKSKIIPLPFLGKIYEKCKLKSINPVKYFKIGIIARWDRIKNHEAVLSLAKAIKKENLPWKIYSVTKIPETKMKQEFKKQYRSYIEVVPQMPYGQISGFIKKMDIMILPSKFDVSPNVVMEAANEGIATLISANVGWINEYQRNGCNRLITDFARPQGVIRTIQTINSPQIVRKIRRMFGQILKKHEKNRIFDIYLKLFKNL